MRGRATQPIKISSVVDSLVLVIIHRSVQYRLQKIFAKYAECCKRGRERVSDALWLSCGVKGAVCCGSCDIVVVVSLLGRHGTGGAGHQETYQLVCGWVGMYELV